MGGAMMTRAGIKLPQFFAVGGAIGAQESVRAALKDKVAGGREHSTAFDQRKG